MSLDGAVQTIDTSKEWAARLQLWNTDNYVSRCRNTSLATGNQHLSSQRIFFGLLFSYSRSMSAPSRDLRGAYIGPIQECLLNLSKCVHYWLKDQGQINTGGIRETLFHG